MGYNFLDHPPRVPRNIFREPEAQPVREPEAHAAAPAAEAPATPAAPAKPVESSAVATVLFRTLKRFPEAYRAVVEALRQLSPDLARHDNF